MSTGTRFANNEKPNIKIIRWKKTLHRKCTHLHTIARRGSWMLRTRHRCHVWCHSNAFESYTCVRPLVCLWVRGACAGCCRPTNAKIRYVWEQQLLLAPTCLASDRPNAFIKRKLIYSYLCRSCIGCSRQHSRHSNQRRNVITSIVTAANDKCDFAWAKEQFRNSKTRSRHWNATRFQRSPRILLSI